MSGALELRGLSVATGPTPLAELDLTVAPGEIVTVMGPSGSGKSTLLSAITGTAARGITVTGRVILAERDITDAPPQARRVGILFQDELLFPHLSVAGNLAFGLTGVVRGRAERQARIADALAEVDLAGFEDRDPATLSGGQKARVALMRMLLAGPLALLLDEPFSRLDAALRDQVRQVVFARVRAQGLPALMVTHDAADAEAAGGRVVDLTWARES